MQGDDKIIPINIESEMKSAYIDYSMSVIVSRALPDVRDGFKPVHRRVLFGMNELGNFFSGDTKKSARIVGEVMGKYHPSWRLFNIFHNGAYGGSGRCGIRWFSVRVISALLTEILRLRCDILR